jgi:GNAT superfamily N-acetyltransferase
MGIFEGAVEDWAAAVNLIRYSWRTNPETPLDYTSEFVNNLLEYPGDGPVLAPARYDDGKLIAFVTGFPRSVQLSGTARKLLLMSFFTVDPAYRGQGLGGAVWADCLRQAKCAGYDGVLHYCVEGNASNAITVSAARSAGFAVDRAFTIRYLMRLLRQNADQPPQPPGPAQAADTALFLQAAESLASALPLSRRWSADEAAWQMRRSGGLFATDERAGMLSGYVLNIADAARTPCLFIEDILWSRVMPEARGPLLQRFLTVASGVAKLAVVPVLEYTDYSVFKAAGFRRSPRTLHAYLTRWDSSPELREFPGMYMDVL